MSIYVYTCMQVKECKNDVNMPSIMRTFHGAQFKLTELLVECFEIEV